MLRIKEEGYGMQSRKRRGSFLILIISVLFGILFSGCGQKTEQSYLAAGMKQIEEMDYDAALASLEAALLAGENERQVERGMGIACMGKTDYEAAIEHFLTSLSLSNGIVIEMDYDINYYMAAAYQKIGKFEEAEAVYTAILAMREDMDAYYLRGIARLAQDRYVDAKEDFDTAVRLEPNNYSRLVQIYEVLYTNGYKEPGLEYLQTALSERSSKMSAFDKGVIHYYLGNYEQAQVFLEEAKADGRADSYLYLGMAYEATGDHNYAITNVYTAYLQNHEGNAPLYNQLGLCYMKQGNYSAALEAFQQAMQIPDNGMMQTLRFNEIIVYEYLGEFTQAEVLLDNYLKNYPDDEEARREYDFLSTR